VLDRERRQQLTTMAFLSCRPCLCSSGRKDRLDKGSMSPLSRSFQLLPLNDNIVSFRHYASCHQDCHNSIYFSTGETTNPPTPPIDWKFLTSRSLVMLKDILTLDGFARRERRTPRLFCSFIFYLDSTPPRMRRN
jgi:hypothetical protein